MFAAELWRCLGPLQIQRKAKPFAVVRYFPESYRFSPRSHASISLEMRVENYFGDREDAAWSQALENLLERGIAIGNFAEHSDQYGAIEPVALELAFTGAGLNKSDICKLCGPRSVSGARQHAGLHIQCNNGASFADAFCKRNYQTSRSATDVQYGHAGSNVQAVDDDGGSIGFRKRIIAFDKPAQPNLARSSAKKQSPDQAGKGGQADEAANDVSCFVHGLLSPHQSPSIVGMLLRFCVCALEGTTV